MDKAGEMLDFLLLLWYVPIMTRQPKRDAIIPVDKRIRREPVSTHRAAMANKRKAGTYLKKLLELAKKAEKDGSTSLAADLYMRLWEHAVGKPKERREVETIGHVQVNIRVIPPRDTSLMEPEKRNALPEPTAQVTDDVRTSLARCYEEIGDDS